MSKRCLILSIQPTARGSCVWRFIQDKLGLGGQSDGFLLSLPGLREERHRSSSAPGGSTERCGVTFWKATI
jgi:hypothetical protein